MNDAERERVKREMAQELDALLGELKNTIFGCDKQEKQEPSEKYEADALRMISTPVKLHSMAAEAKKISQNSKNDWYVRHAYSDLAKALYAVTLIRLED